MTYIGLVCHGQEVRLNLQECIDAALRDNLDLRSSNLEVAKSQDLQGSWLDLPQTSISLSQDPTSGGSPDNAVTFSQSFEFPTSYVSEGRDRGGQIKSECKPQRGNPRCKFLLLYFTDGTTYCRDSSKARQRLQPLRISCGYKVQGRRNQSS